MIRLLFTLGSLFVSPSLLPALEPAEQIDALLSRGYQRLEVQPNPIADDSTFVRRAFLNITGRIPTAAEARAFLDDSSATKRSELIDRLVASDGFDHHLFNFYADLLRLQTRSRMAGLGWHLWLKDSVRENRPYDELVYEMLSATGHVSENGAIGYYLRDRNMLLDNVSNSVQVFLGMRIECAQCHDDPFKETTQMDYYLLAAFSGGMDYESPFSNDRLVGMLEEYSTNHNVPFSRKLIGKKRGYKPEFEPIKSVERDIKDLFTYYQRMEVIETDRQLKLPDDYAYDDGSPGEALEPDTLYGARLNLADYPNRKAAFASWLTSSENARFATNIANRLWSHAFGYGLHMPLDDWEETDRILHPEVLEYLTKLMLDNDFDVRGTLRVLYQTQLFQRTANPDEVAMGGKSDFRGPILRRLTAEEIYDSIQTMQYGNIDAAEHPRMRTIWKNYIESAELLRTASTERLFELDESLDQSSQEKGSRSNREKELKNALARARKSKDSTGVERLQAEIMQLKRSAYGIEVSGEAALIQPVTKDAANLGPAGNGLRASELPTPFLPGSMVRKFGGSDRQTPNAGHTKPSIPQMLAMLNGEDALRLTGKKSKLLSEIRKSSTPSDQLDQLFLTLYSAYPTDAEREQFEPLLSNDATIATLARAILTSKRFLFVQ